ncbi:uncharacterized protein LOC112523871 [Cynara cardunculus var. scolymus]|uniref:uncharacterized protein LOC112523871 n=1 Tax=Cynara cardunculus var. scolymus TaxID=59895 RepID=UPI000D62EC33|nr:uncharacterized protein LOC112523871 [Cynara cardunculus var. scolymus]
MANQKVTGDTQAGGDTVSVSVHDRGKTAEAGQQQAAEEQVAGTDSCKTGVVTEIQPGRRPGRRPGGGTSQRTLLPLRHVSHLSNSISCWYCDFKSSVFNEPLFRFGRKYSRSTRNCFLYPPTCCKVLTEKFEPRFTYFYQFYYCSCIGISVVFGGKPNWEYYHGCFKYDAEDDSQDSIKLDIMDEMNFTRWKEKMKFLLTVAKVYYVLETPQTAVLNQEEQRQRENDDMLWHVKKFYKNSKKKVDQGNKKNGSGDANIVELSEPMTEITAMDYKESQEGHEVMMGNNHTSKVLGTGSIELAFTSGKKVILKDVLHVPTIRKNLVFGYKLCKFGTRAVIESDKVILSKAEDAPKTYREAMTSRNAACWKEAIDDEMDFLISNNTWEISDLPPGSKAIGCKWVSRVKLNIDGSVQTFKARLVIQGFSQRQGVDYFDTYAPVARITSTRILFALASIHKLPIRQMDVKTTFLNGELDEEVYMKQPEGFILPRNENREFVVRNHIVTKCSFPTRNMMLCFYFTVHQIILLESARALNLYDGIPWLHSVQDGSILELYSPVFKYSISVADVGYMCISSIISVSVHELGHALAATSEGIQIEYTALFLAVIVPGALVAFNNEMLQMMPCVATLRIYCAGVWHNAALCVVCALAVFLLPLILCPLYSHGESLMVLEHGYLLEGSAFFLLTQDESCSTPIHMPGLAWAEITFSRPYSPECQRVGNKMHSSYNNSGSGENSCSGTFVFIGDMMSMARSIWLTEYQSRWLYGVAYIPAVVEKMLVNTFHVSLMLVVLNSLPVYHLDGESILEVALCCFGSLTPTLRKLVLQSSLLAGTLISCIFIFRILCLLFRKHLVSSALFFIREPGTCPTYTTFSSVISKFYRRHTIVCIFLVLFFINLQ